MQTLEARCSVICTRPVVSKWLCQVLKLGQFDAIARPFLVNLSPQALSFFSHKANTLEKAFSEVKWCDCGVSFLWDSVQEKHWSWWIYKLLLKGIKHLNIMCQAAQFPSGCTQWNPSLLLYCSQWIIWVSSLPPAPGHSVYLSQPPSWC